MSDVMDFTLDQAAYRTTNGSSAVAQLRADVVLGRGETPKQIATNAAWRQLVLSRARRARHELLAALANPEASVPGANGEEAAEHILRAKEAATKRAGPWTWFEGSHQEQAWLSLHEAEAEIIELLAGAELAARTHDVLRKARRSLGRSDPRVTAVEAALSSSGTPAEQVRPLVAQLARATYDARDDQYAQSRGFRNRLIRTSLLVFGAVVLVLLAAPVAKLDFNLGGGSTPIPAERRMTLAVALFGTIGALVTAVPPLARANGARNPFSLPFFQLLLKLAMGPLFSLVGVMLLQGALVPGVKAADSLSTLLVWATLFGGAQQGVTRFVDQRVTGLLSSERTQTRKTSTGQPPVDGPADP